MKERVLQEKLGAGHGVLEFLVSTRRFEFYSEENRKAPEVVNR
jgi:hypothetical protein